MCRQRDQLWQNRGGSRDDACVIYCEVDGPTILVWREVGLMARLRRARDIVPFV